MNLKITLLVLLFAQSTYGQFKPNSIGVVTLTKESKESYFFTITLHGSTLAKYKFEKTGAIGQPVDSIAHTGNILFFDEKGQQAVMYKKLNFKITPWCDRDSTMRYKVTVDMVIRKTDFKRKVEVLADVQNISGFVILNNNHQKTEHPDYTVSTNIKLKGDFDNDGQADCFIWTYAAKDCDTNPANNMGIKLQIAKNQFSFRCCEL